MLFASQSAIPTNSTGFNSITLTNGGGVVASGASGVNGWLASGAITNNGAQSLMALPTGANAEDINWTGVNGVYSNMYLGAALSNTATFLGTLTPVGTNYLLGGGGGTLIIGNPNTFTDNAYTNRGLWIGSALTASNNVVQVLGAQSYSGPTVVSNTILSVASDSSLGYGNLTLNNNSSLQITNTSAPFVSIRNIALNTGAGTAVFDIGSGSTATMFGAISNPTTGNSIQKMSPGTLILSNNNAVLGSVFQIRGGTMIIDGGAVYSNNSTLSVGLYTGESATLLVRNSGQLLAPAGDLNIGDTQTNAVGVMTVQDSAVVTVGNTYAAKSGSGTLNINGGTMSVGNLIVGNAASALGTVNLNGGVLLVRGSTGIYNLGGTSGFFFAGGTLRAGNNFYFSNSLNSAVIQAGGAYLDASNYTLTINKQLSGSGNLIVSNSGYGSVVLNNTSTNANTGAMLANVGILRFDNQYALGGAAPYTNRNLFANYGGTVAIGGTFTNVDYLLSRMTNFSLGTVAWSTSMSSNLNLQANLLTNVSFGAVYGNTVTNLGGIITPVNQTYRLGGGGGTLVITNYLTAGTNLIAFGSGSGGTLVLYAGSTNAWTSSQINGGLVQYATTNAMGRNVLVNLGGSISSTGALADASILNQVTAGSAGTLALVTSNNVALNMSAFPNLSIGATGGSVTNYAMITPAGTTYRLGGGGGTLVFTNDLALTGGGYNLVAFGGGSGGTLTLNGSNSFTGGTTINTGIVTIANAAGLGSGAIVVSNGAALRLQTSGMTLNQNLTLSGAGAGTAANSYGALLMNVNGGVFTFNGVITLNGGAVIDDYHSATTTNTIVQGIGGTGDLTLAGGAANNGNTIYVLQGRSTYTGDTILNTFNSQGITVRIETNNAVPVTTVLRLQATSGTTTYGKFMLNGYNQEVAGLQGSVAANTTNSIVGGSTAQSVLTVNNTANYTYDGQLGNTGANENNLSLVKTGIGVLTLTSGGNTFNGAVTISNGVLALGHALAVQSNTVINLVSNGLGFASGNTYTLGGLAGAGNITLWSSTGGGVNLSIGLNNSNTSFSGIMDDIGTGNYFMGSLNKIGTGALTLTGTNSYNGPTVVKGGILVADFGAGLPAANWLTLSNGSLGSVSGLITNDIGTGAGLISISGGAAGFSAFDTPTTVALGGTASPTALVWSNTAGFNPAALVLNETAANASLTFTNALDLNGATRTIIVNSTNAGAFVNIPSIISDSTANLSGLIKGGNGVLLLTATNTYDGVTTVSGGILQAEFGEGMNAATNVTLNGGTLSSVGGSINNVLGTDPLQINISGGASGFSAYNTNLTVNLGGAADLVTWGSATFNPGPLVLNDYAANTNLTLLNQLDLNGAARTIAVRNATAYLPNGLTNSLSASAGGLAKYGTGTLIVSNTTGGLTLNAANGFVVKGGTFWLASGSITSLNNSVDYVANTTGDNATMILSGSSVFRKTQNSFVLAGAAAGNTGVLLLQDNALLSSAGSVYVGDYGTGLVYQTGGSLVGGANLILGGGRSGNAGAYYQLGGLVNLTANQLQLGTGAGSYGYYQKSGGVMTNNAWTQVGTTGLGIYYQDGGTNVTTANGFLVAGNSGTGVVYMTGGLFTENSGLPFDLGYNNTANGRAEVTISTNATVLLNNASVIMNRANAAIFNSTDYLNLNGGLLQANNIYKGTNVGYTVVNFNGGTLRAGTPGILLGPGTVNTYTNNGSVDAAYVRSGGAIIDVTNYAVTISQNLLTPSGSGVVSIATGSLAGYVGAPYVVISGGGGTGATAVALFDYTSGTVTGIVVTSAGDGYTNTPTITLQGGGRVDYQLGGGSVTLGTNTSGSLTILGANGMLALSGTNTFAGGINLVSGGLMFNNSNALPANVTSLLVPFGTSLGVTNDAASLFGGGLSNMLASGFMDLNSSGTLAAAYTIPATEVVNFNTQGYTNMSLGAAAGFTVTNLAPLYTVDNAYRLGGGGGTLVLSNNSALTGGNWLNAFASGTGGNLLLTGTNNFSGGTFIGCSLGTATVNLASIGTGAITNNGVLVYNQSVDATNALVHSGSGSVQFTGPGLVLMVASNTYSGGTVVYSNSWLLVTNPCALGYGGIILTNSGMLRFSGNNTYTNAATLFGGDGLGKAGYNGIMQNASGTNTWQGPIMVSNAAPRIGVTAGILTVSGGITGNNGIVLNPSTSMKLVVDTNPILLSGNNTVTFNSGGTNWLNVGGNAFSNATIAYGNTLLLGVDDALPTNVVLKMNNGTSDDIGNTRLALNGHNQTVGTLWVASSNAATLNTIDVGANTLAVNGDVTIGCALTSSTTRLSVIGTGSLVINKDGGNMKLGIVTVANVGAKSLVDLSGLGTFSMDLGSGTLSIGSGNNVGGWGSILTLAGSNYLRAANVIIGASDLGSSHTLRLGAGSNLFNVGALNIGTYGRDYGSLLFNGSSGSLTLRDASGTGRANVNIGDNANGTGYIATNIFDVTGHYADLYIGTLTMGDYSARGGGWTNAFAFDQGVMDISRVELAKTCKAGVVGVANLNIGGGTVLLGSVNLSSSSATGTLNITGGTVTMGGDITNSAGGRGVVILNGGLLDMQNNNLGTANGFISNLNFQAGTLQNVAEINGGAPLVMSSAGTLNIAGVNSYTGGTIVSNGTVNVTGDQSAATGSWKVGPTAANTTTVNFLTNSIIVVAASNQIQIGNTTSVGAAIQTLNSFGTVTNNGTLYVGRPGYLNLAAGSTWLQNSNMSINGQGGYGSSMTVSNGATFTYTGPNAVQFNPASVSAGSASLTIGGTFITGQGFTNATASSLGAANLILDGGTLQLSANIPALMTTAGSTNSFQLAAGGGAIDTGVYTAGLNQVISGAGALTKLGAGTLLLSGQNTYGGSTVVSNGTLKLGVNNALPTTTQLYADTLGSVDLAGWNQQVGGINGYKGTLANSAGSGSLTVNFTGTQSFLGTVTGASTLTLTGGGTLEATAASTFGGSVTTLVTSGSTLIMNGTHSGVITTYAASTNGGSGAISTLNVMSSGAYMPGATLGLGTQTVNNLTLNPGGLLAVGLTAASNGLARVDTTFAMTNALLQLNLANYTYIYGQKITLVDYTGATGFDWNDSTQLFTLNDVGGPSNTVLWAQGLVLPVTGGTSSTNFFRIDYNDIANGGHAITLTAIPEPGTVSLIGLVGAAWLLRRIRRRRAQG